MGLKCVPCAIQSDRKSTEFAHTPTSFAWIEKISQKSSPCSGTLHVARRAVSTRSMLTSQGRRGRRAVDIRSGHRRRRPGRATVVTAARCGLRP